MTGAARAMPHFIVIGAQKSGTSSIFSYLRQHPQVLAPIFKEPYFFDRQYHRGLKWYGCNFPSCGTIDRLNQRHGRKHLTFEATATYIFDADVPARISRDIPTRKFILLLRNPVERAVSAYWHARRMGRETRSLADALDADLRYFEAEHKWEKGAGPRPEGEPPRPSYVRRGIYHEAVFRWQSVFSPQDILVIQSETMFANPQDTMKRVFTFLELPQSDRIDFEPQNVGGYGDSDREARNMLKDFYRPHNAELSRIIGAELDW
jgi:hypothetical protein